MAVESWSVSDVTAYLEKLELQGLVESFKENAVDGKELLSLSEDDMKEFLGCKPLQIRKIKKNLPSNADAPGTSTLPPTPASAPAAAPTPAPEAAAAAAPAGPAGPPSGSREAVAGMPASGYPPAPAPAGCPVGYPPAPAPAGYPAGYPPAPAPTGYPAVPAGYPAVPLAQSYPGPPPAAAPASTPGAPPSVGADKPAGLQAEVAELEQAAAQLRRKAEGAQEQAGTCGKAAGLLKQANAKLEGAVKALRGVQVTGMMDMRHDRRVGMVGLRNDAPFGAMRLAQHNPGATMLEMGMVRKANEACQSAAEDVAKAKALLPEMPGIKEASIQSARGGVFANALMPGRAGDIMQMAAVRQGTAQVEGMMREVGQALQWTSAQLAGAEGKARELGTQAAAKQAEADAIKRMQAH